eukprot:jgi/Psemu1/67326/estExt_Genemark1.C_3040036
MSVNNTVFSDYAYFSPQLGFPEEGFRMEVSDDDGSMVDTTEAVTLGWYAGIASPNAATSGDTSRQVFNHEPHQITPQLLHPEEVLTTRTTWPVATTNAGKQSKDNKIVHNVNSLPLLPPFDPRLVGGQTALTIRKRRSRTLNSPIELVDGYEVNNEDRAPETQAGLNVEESRERHYFNARRQPAWKLAADTRPGPRNEKGINKNQVNQVENLDLHKIADHLDRNPNFDEAGDCHSDSSSRRQESHKPQTDNVNTIVTNKNTKKKTYKRPSATTMMSSQVAHCLPRQRSRAIAINRARPVGIIDGYRSESRDSARERDCDSELYDYATWRMYNRIIDHRRYSNGKDNDNYGPYSDPSLSPWIKERMEADMYKSYQV